MDDTLEKRIADLEYVFAHLPQDLDARFAGADVRAEARTDRLNIRIQTLETRVRQVEQVVAGNSARLQALETGVRQVEQGVRQVEQAVAGNSAKLQSIEARVQQAEQSVTAKLDEILSRLAKT